jgi:hypothetical protein
MSTATAIPDSVGLWELRRPDGDAVIFEAYLLPTGHLVAWCDDVGIPGGIDQSILWDDDEWVGHVPSQCMVGWGEFRKLSEGQP